MVRFGLVIIVSLLCAPLWAQTSEYPKGAYLSIEELVAKKPSMQIALKASQRSKNTIELKGGNDYTITSYKKLISNKTIKKEILAFSDGESLYLNCFRYGIQEGYSSVLKDGKYLIFTAGLSSDSNLLTYQLDRNNSLNLWKSLGNRDGKISEIKKTALRFLYVVDTKTNELIMIDEISIRKLLLKASTDLLKNFDEAVTLTKDKEALIFEYLDLLNQAYLLN